MNRITITIFPPLPNKKKLILTSIIKVCEIACNARKPKTLQLHKLCLPKLCMPRILTRTSPVHFLAFPFFKREISDILGHCRLIQVIPVSLPPQLTTILTLARTRGDAPRQLFLAARYICYDRGSFFFAWLTFQPLYTKSAMGKFL